MSRNYSLRFDLEIYAELEAFGRKIACKKYLGNKDDWLNHFIWGLHGLRARLFGVTLHYYYIHSWNLIADARVPISQLEWHIYDMTEYHLSTILFHMDSAIECTVFALNAVGYAIDPAQFKDLTKIQELKRIYPSNIIGRPPDFENGLLPGYPCYFPSLSRYWRENRDLVMTISEQHDVSKHRSATLEGGKRRTNPPKGLMKSLGIENNKARQIALAPFQEIPLTPQPKLPPPQRDNKEHRDIPKLEEVAEKFCRFLNTTGAKALKDASVALKVDGGT